MESKKKWYKWTYLQNRNRLRDRKQTYGYQRGEGRRINQEYDINKRKKRKKQGEETVIDTKDIEI